MTTRTLRLAACLAALGVVASACGDDGADADTAPTTSSHRRRHHGTAPRMCR